MDFEPGDMSERVAIGASSAFSVESEKMTNDQFPNDQTMTNSQDPRILATGDPSRRFQAVAAWDLALELPWSLVLGHWTFLPILPTETSMTLIRNERSRQCCAGRIRNTFYRLNQYTNGNLAIYTAGAGGGSLNN